MSEHDATERPDVPLRRLRGDGVYRRRIRLTRLDPTTALAELEDDFHAFAAKVGHDGRVVRTVTGEPRRVPWTTCPGALTPLRSLVGVSLSRDPDALAATTDVQLQCTHWFDAACLAISHACTARPSRLYDIAVQEPWQGIRTAELRADGHLTLRWEVEQMVVRTDGVFSGCSLVGGGFRAALSRLGDPDAREAAFVLRKGVLLSFARLYDMDLVRAPASFAGGIGARCHTFGPGVAEKAERVVGATRDFTSDPEGPLSSG